ncbi:MAG: tetratricopeptide repeat protein [Deltaproteobacteria bacterium]|nr:tetratricopeptide repeat protein [Deltaproteobacteria bacterium]
MKRSRTNVLVSVLLMFCAGMTTAVWGDEASDAYDKGIKFLSEGRQRDAITAFDQAIRLNPRSAEAYLGRGMAYNETGKNEQALKDYDAALALNPQYAEAYFNRGNTYSDLGQHERALKDYNETVRLDSNHSGAVFNRSVANMFLRHPETAADARAYVKLKGWKDERTQYMVIFGAFGDRWAQRETEARQLLDEAAANCNTSAWPYPVIRYLRRDMSVDDLLAAATDPDKKTEARAYLGLDLVLAGKQDEALTHLHWVKDNGKKNFSEYAFAVSELGRLEAGAGN